ncbi:MAG: Fur family transcriptional regulator [Gammaproteobacteria bacterium]
MNSAPIQSRNGHITVASRLRASGITPTQQRVRIGEALFSKAQHVSAEQVLSMVNKDNDEVSKATVYNTLGLFAKKGLLHEVIIEANKVFYDTNLEKHHHLYHIDTSRLEDISANQVKIEQLPKLPEGTVLEDVDVIIRLRKS